jgi:hypothetical protein
MKVVVIRNVPVPQKKSRKDGSRRAAAILEEHFATLSESAEAKARKDLHKLASAVSCRTGGKWQGLTRGSWAVSDKATYQDWPVRPLKSLEVDGTFKNA